MDANQTVEPKGFGTVRASRSHAAEFLQIGEIRAQRVYEEIQLAVVFTPRFRPLSAARCNHAMRFAWVQALAALPPCATFINLGIARAPARTATSWMSARTPNQWFVAARKGDVDMLEELLSEGTDVNCASFAAKGSTALHLAASFGRIEAARLLIEKGANVKAAAAGISVLHAAAFKNQTSIVQMLLDAGADPDVEQAQDGSTALLEAAAMGNTAVARALLAAGADPNKGVSAMPLHSAAYKGHADVVELLLAEGADVNASEEDGGTALLKAAAAGNEPSIALLLAAGADANTARASVSALHYAAYGGHMGSVQALLDAGADPTCEDEGGNSALSYALMQSDHARCSHALLKAGAPFIE